MPSHFSSDFNTDFAPQAVGMSQSDVGVVDGNGKISIAPATPPVSEVLVNWALPSFRGNQYKTISAISTTGGILTSRTSGAVPFAFSASGSAITATGTSRPWEDLEFRWTLTDDATGAIVDNEGMTNPNSGVAVNPFTDQVEPEVGFLIRYVGNFTLTLTIRGDDGAGGYITAQTTASITTSAYTGTHKWYDAAGNDANDGLDAYGFAVTGGSYNDTTKELTKTGAFTSYGHAVATADDHVTYHSNFVYLTGGTGITPGLYEIASNPDNDTLVLATSAGSTASDVTTSDGPKQTLPSTATADLWEHITGTHSRTGMWSVSNKANIRLTRYGTAAMLQAITGYSGRGMIDKVTGSSGNVVMSDCFVGGFTVDAQQFAAQPVYHLASTTGTSDFEQHYYADMVLLEGTANNSIQVQSATATIGQTGFWNCIIKRLVTAENSNFIKCNTPWVMWIGGSVDMNLARSNFDHHIYTSGYGGHRMFRWIKFGTDTPVAGNGSACFNINCGAAGDPVAEHILVVENHITTTGIHVLMDAGSNGSNDRLSLFNHTIISANGSLKAASLDQGLWGKALQNITLRFNAFDLSDTDWVLSWSKEVAASIYDNKIYGPLLRTEGAFTDQEGDLFAEGNEFKADNTDFYFWELDFANAGGATIEIDNNTYQYDNDTDGKVFQDNGSSTNYSLADWKSLGFGGAGETNAAVGWTDPANGDWT